MLWNRICDRISPALIPGELEIQFGEKIECRCKQVFCSCTLNYVNCLVRESVGGDVLPLWERAAVY